MHVFIAWERRTLHETQDPMGVEIGSRVKKKFRESETVEGSLCSTDQGTLFVEGEWGVNLQLGHLELSLFYHIPRQHEILSLKFRSYIIPI